MDVDLVGGGDQPPELALGAARIVLDRAELGGQPVVLLRRLSRRRVRTVALHCDLTRREVRAFSLVGEPRPPLRKLGLTLPRLGEALRQVAPDRALGRPARDPSRRRAVPPDAPAPTARARRSAPSARPRKR